MKVGVLGTGDVGRSLGGGFIALGHEVKIGARTPDHEKALAWVGAMGRSASQGTFADAARFGEIVVFATLGVVNPEVVKAAGAKSLAGKVIIDATNPLDFSKGFPPDLALKGNDSGGETLQRAAPEAKVVKAFNIVSNALMFRPELPGGPPDMFIAGNDAVAKARVTKVLNDFGWPRVIDFGGIASARWLEAMAIAWTITGAATGNWNQAFKMLQR
jgi:8-hydroxy-5-deazaflavin:NADPH oxidoreductase